MSLNPAAGKEIEIAGRRIGPGHPPFVIAEMSGNHNGSLQRALDTVDAVAATGADRLPCAGHSKAEARHG